MPSSSIDQTESAIRIRPLKQSDLAAALLLTQQAHWNQTESDWLRLLKLEPHGCFVACSDPRVIGTITTVTYQTELAWIGMVLVDPEFRLPAEFDGYWPNPRIIPRKAFVTGTADGT